MAKDGQRSPATALPESVENCSQNEQNIHHVAQHHHNVNNQVKVKSGVKLNDQIKKTISKLNDFDEKLKLKKLSYKRSKIINKLMEVSKDDEITLLLTELKKVE